MCQGWPHSLWDPVSAKWKCGAPCWKILGNFEMVTAEQLNQEWSPLNMGPCAAAQLPVNPALVCICVYDLAWDVKLFSYFGLQANTFQSQMEGWLWPPSESDWFWTVNIQPLPLCSAHLHLTSRLHLLRSCLPVPSWLCQLQYLGFLISSWPFSWLV